MMTKFKKGSVSLFKSTKRMCLASIDSYSRNMEFTLSLSFQNLLHTEPINIKNYSIFIEKKLKNTEDMKKLKDMKIIIKLKN